MAAAVGSKLWRTWLSWRFRLWQQHRHRALVLEHVAGRPIVVLPEVFNPTLFFSSELLAGVLSEIVQPGDTMLDVGTGSGVQGITAAARGARVVAVDILPAAVRCARMNVLLNGVESLMEVRQGDLFAHLANERFDLVAFNPPFYRGRPNDPWEHAWRGTDVLDRFAAGLRDVLAPSGRAVVVVSTHMTGVDEVVSRHQFNARVLRERRMPGERLTVWEWKPIPVGERP